MGKEFSLLLTELPSGKCRKIPKRKIIFKKIINFRALVKIIEGLSDEEVNQLNLPNSIPFVYDLDPESMKPLRPKRYLADKDLVAKAIDKVASIGPNQSEVNNL